MVSKGAGTEIGSAASNHPGKETADNWAGEDSDPVLYEKRAENIQCE